MLRIGLISLLVLLVAGCGFSSKQRNFLEQQKQTVAAHNSGMISESEKYRRFLGGFRALPAKDKAGLGYNETYFEQRVAIAEAYESKKITTAQYLELKQQALAYVEAGKARLQRAAQERSAAIGKALSDYSKSLNKQPYYTSPIPSPNQARGRLQRDYVDGMNRICIYDDMGSQRVITVGASNLCPM